MNNEKGKGNLSLPIPACREGTDWSRQDEHEATEPKAPTRGRGRETGTLRSKGPLFAPRLFSSLPYRTSTGEDRERRRHSIDEETEQKKEASKREKWSGA